MLTALNTDLKQHGTGPEKHRTSSTVPDSAISDSTKNGHHASFSGEILLFLLYFVPLPVYSPRYAMESLVDVTTTAFEAILGVCVVFGAGYAYNSKLDSGSGKVSHHGLSAFACSTQCR